MPSERRLHPLSILFNISKRFGALLIPLAVVIAGRGSEEDRWSVYALAFLVPYGIAVVGGYLSFRYRYEPGELVIRRGLVFRSQRHIPYDRIQNIDAVQNVFHRLAGVAEVKVQTAGGSEPEATLSVLSVSDLDEMRRLVFGRAGAARAGVPADRAPEAESAASRVLLHLPPRELVLFALIENRGFVVIAAAIGILSEFRVFSNLLERYLGEEAGRGLFRAAARTLFVDGGPSGRTIALGVVAFLALLLVSRLFSIVWAQVRLHGYTLRQVGEDLRAQYGLLTRVTATVPVRRIQAVTIRDTPLHRLLGRASVRVTTAGGGGSGDDKAPQHREWIAPIVRRDEVPAFVGALVPGADLSAFDWQPVHPRAFRRLLTRWGVVSAVIVTAAALAFGPDALWLALPLGAWAAFGARREAHYLAWTLTPDVVATRSGAFVHIETVAPLARLQVVLRHESPFDRRTTMRRVAADTAGGGGIDVPFLPPETADDLYGRLAAAAAHTRFRW